MDLIAATALVISNWIQIIDFSAHATLKLDGWPIGQKTIGHFFHTMSSFVHLSNPSVNSNWSYSPETLNSGRNWWYFVRCDLDSWWMTLENNRACLLYYIKLCCFISNPSVKSNLSYSPEMLNSGQNRHFFIPCDHEIWRMTLKNNRAPLLYHIKLCASFQSHGWLQTGVTVRKR